MALWTLVLLSVSLSTAQKGLGISDGSFEAFKVVDSVSQIDSWCDCSLVFPKKHHAVSLVKNKSTFGESPIQLDTSEQALILYADASGKYSVITQKLPRKLKIGEDYRIKLSAQFLPILNIRDAAATEYTSFANPISLRIYTGTAYCDQSEMLFEKEIIDNQDWQEFYCDFQAIERTRYLTIMAVYTKDQTYNGHFLLDDLSIEKMY